MDHTSGRRVDFIGKKEKKVGREAFGNRYNLRHKSNLITAWLKI
jgi:hypothetical protein